MGSRFMGGWHGPLWQQQERPPTPAQPGFPAPQLRPCALACRMAAASITIVLQDWHWSRSGAAPTACAAGAPVPSARSAERSVRSASGAGRLRGWRKSIWEQHFGSEQRSATSRSSLPPTARRMRCLQPLSAARQTSIQSHLPSAWGQKSNTEHTPCASTSCSRPSRAANRSVTSPSHLACEMEGRKDRWN